MASIDDVISLTITKATATASRTSFGLGMAIACTPTAWAERVRSYTKLSAVLADFPDSGGVSHPVYDMAAAYFAQNPRPKRLKVGRRALAFTEVYTLTVLTPATVDGTVTKITVEGTEYSVTAGASETTTTIATALAAAIDPNANVTATSSVAVVTVTSTAAKRVLRLSGWDTSKLQIKNTTPDPGIATDLAAIIAEDNNFHDFALDSQSAAQIDAAADYVASLDKEYWFDSSDTLAETSSTADIFSTIKGELYANVNGFYNLNGTRNYRCMRAMAIALTRDPGTYTLKFKQLLGDAADAVNDTADGYLKGKNANRYIDFGAGPMIAEGVAGSGEFEDVTRFLHWVKQEMKARALEALAGPDKVPFTNAGIETVGAAIRSVIQDGIKREAIADDPDNPPSVTVPAALDVAEADRLARNLTDIEFAFRLAGAIHSADVEGTVSV